MMILLLQLTSTLTWLHHVAIFLEYVKERVWKFMSHNVVKSGIIQSNLVSFILLGKNLIAIKVPLEFG